MALRLFPEIFQETAFELNTMNPVLQELYTNMLKLLGLGGFDFGVFLTLLLAFRANLSPQDHNPQQTFLLVQRLSFQKHGGDQELTYPQVLQDSFLTLDSHDKTATFRPNSVLRYWIAEVDLDGYRLTAASHVTADFTVRRNGPQKRAG